MRVRFLVPAGLLSFALLGGCGKIKKKEECNNFIEKANAALTEVKKYGNAANKDDAKAIADMKKLAGIYEQLAKDVGALPITTAELKKQVTDYQAMASKAAATAKDVAKAIETQDAAKAEAAQKEFDKIVKQEDALVTKINGFCREP